MVDDGDDLKSLLVDKILVRRRKRPKELFISDEDFCIKVIIIHRNVRVENVKFAENQADELCGKKRSVMHFLYNTCSL